MVLFAADLPHEFKSRYLGQHPIKHIHVIMACGNGLFNLLTILHPIDNMIVPLQLMLG